LTIDANIIGDTTQNYYNAIDTRHKKGDVGRHTTTTCYIKRRPTHGQGKKLYRTAVVKRQNGRAAEEPVVSDAGGQKFTQARFGVGKPAR